MKNLAKVLAVYLPPTIVAVLALGLAGWAYEHFLQVPRQLWTSVIHDRNTHYLLGLSLALDLRNGDALQLFHDLDGARVWPPLHGLVVGLILAVGNPDFRLAVLPSLSGWVGAVVFGFLAARRMVPQGGTLAGFVAALFILASPAHQAYATDIMLESMGAGLTMLVLYLYLVTVQEDSVWAGRGLAVALTALFLHKYNYWLLVMLALVATELTGRWQFYRHLFAGNLIGFPWRRWAWAQFYHPLNYALGGVLIVLASVLLSGGDTVKIGGLRVSLHTPHNLVTVAYLLLFLRMLPWCWRAGRPWVRELNDQARPLVTLHALPIALWFLWPKRLGYFLWYLSPAQGGETPHHDLGGWAFYWQALVTDYHLATWCVVLVGGLMALAVLGRRRLRPGGQVMLWLVLIAVLLTIHHPNRKNRFLHSWIAGGWVAAGAGLAGLVYGRSTASRPGSRPWLAAASVGGLALLQFPAMVPGGHAAEGGPRLNQASSLEVTDSYLPALAGSRASAVLANLPIRSLCSWTYQERFGRSARVETDLKGFGSSEAENQRTFENWLRTTSCDRLVFIDVPPESCFHEDVPYPNYDHFQDFLNSQTLFCLTRNLHLPQYGCTVNVWSRQPGMLSAAPVPTNHQP